MKINTLAVLKIPKLSEIDFQYANRASRFEFRVPHLFLVACAFESSPLVQSELILNSQACQASSAKLSSIQRPPRTQLPDTIKHQTVSCPLISSFQIFLFILHLSVFASRLDRIRSFYRKARNPNLFITLHQLVAQKRL